MKIIWCCDLKCRNEFEIAAEANRAGCVVECPKCRRVYGRLRQRIGPLVWVQLEPSQVEFHRLLASWEDE